MPDLPLGPADRVIVAGASGLIGRALVASLRARGVAVTTLVRRPAVRADEVSWDPAAGLDPEILRGSRAVVVLNGASIGRLPWTRQYTSTLLWSRLTPVRAVAASIDALDDPPQLVTASAVGYYGSRPGEILTEDACAGSGILADLCVEVERAARRIADRTRVTSLRIAPVIHVDGVLKPLVTLTRLGVAGPLGRGTQTWPWITLPDVAAAILHVIDARIDGPVNLTSPTRATADDIGFALAVHLERQYLVRTPAWALRLALGDAADGLLLTDAHVVPAVLADTGFTWTHTDVAEAVASALPRD